MIYWIWLQSAVGYGYKYIKPLLERYKTAENVYHAPFNDLEFSGLFSKLALSKLKNKDLDAARKVLNECIKRKISIVTIGDEKYPPLLNEIPNPPIVLYTKGNLELLDCRPGVCIVGPREVSDFGKKAAFSLGARLAAGGITIVSGGAKGSDTAAHKGALAVGGNTVCILAVGIEDDYLQLNKELRAEIAKAGLLVSEFQPGSVVRKGTFSIRNRLMSGLTLGTVVIEADEKSGALITANYAAEQNRDVFVIPGNPTLPHYKGSNLLLQDGAKALLDAKDIFFEYLADYPHKIYLEKAYKEKIKFEAEPEAKKKQPAAAPAEKGKEEFIKKNITSPLSNSAKMVYNQLDKQVFFADEIVVPELSASQFLAAITELEIFGYIQALPGGRYTLK